MMQAFTRNYEDNSTEAGFQFTFYCDVCEDGFRSSFIESQTYKKGNLFKGLSRGVSAAAGLFGGLGGLSYAAHAGESVLSERFNGMSPDWHKEHENAFAAAQNESKQHYHRCHKCHKWVCDTCWNDEAGLCAECAPRVNVEIAAARADKMKRDIWDKADQTQVFHGDIEQKATFCPNCGKPAGQSKFCTSCGTSLGLNVCPKCGAENDQSVRFCGECGTKLK
ncbi:MAG: zinc ribbon domain-containing protein [Eubacteriales bacterium]|nr:zinc ribbon domain-containing protein [Eubacteriales bacterium]